MRMVLEMNDKELAKLIIAEIIRQAGGELQNKTNLYKAFYYAHIFYADAEAGYLSNWPIVKMPNGPGIDRSDVLLGELMADEVLTCRQVRKRSCFAFVFRLSDKGKESPQLNGPAIEAISKAVEKVVNKTASRVSHESHLHSRSWRQAAQGERLAIYGDSIPKGEFRDRQNRIADIADTVRSVWGEPTKRA